MPLRVVLCCAGLRAVQSCFEFFGFVDFLGLWLSSEGAAGAAPWLAVAVCAVAWGAKVSGQRVRALLREMRQSHGIVGCRDFVM